MQIRIHQSLANGFTVAWFASAFLAVVVPLLTFWAGQAPNNDYNEQQQNNKNQQNDSPYSCRWYEWGCKRQERKYYQYQEQGQNNGGNQDDQEFRLPFWMRWFFLTEEQRREREEMGAPNSALVFVYCWSLCLFLGIVYYGYRQIRNEAAKANYGGVIAALVVFANMSFLTLLFLGGLEGGIQTEGPEVEETGFYGQFPVLLFLTNFFYTMYGAIFAILFWHKLKRVGVEVVDVDGSNYTSWNIWNKETV